MGSSYLGVPNNIENKTHSRNNNNKGKKSSSVKPKQPQRGLGVAQLEQIRLRTQMGCALNPSSVQDNIRIQEGQNYGVPQSSTSYPYSQSLPSTSSPYAHHPNFMMVFGDEMANITYQDSHHTTATRWTPNNNGLTDNSTYSQAASSSRHLYSHYEDSSQEIDFFRSMGSNTYNSDSSEHEEVDLELRLSI